MAYAARCDRCGCFGLTVRATGGRRCVSCCVAVEFVPGVGRRLKGFIRSRVLRDDARDDRESGNPLHAAAVCSQTEFFRPFVEEIKGRKNGVLAAGQ